MTKKRDKGSGDEPVRLRMGRDELRAKLREQMEQGRELLGSPQIRLPELEKRASRWRSYNDTLIQQAFSARAAYLKHSPEEGGHVWYQGMPKPDPVTEERESISGWMECLSDLIEQLELYQEASELVEERGPYSDSQQRTDVFIVHGHNNEVKETVARFVHRVTGNQPTILHEQADQGRTIVEKFEDHARRTAFAICIFTADDEGGSRLKQERKPRARQNVVFECGFFIGGLGRQNVFLLLEENVEQPSDLSGYLYTCLDPAGAWKAKLAKEMRAAGLDVDLEAAIDSY